MVWKLKKNKEMKKEIKYKAVGMLLGDWDGIRGTYPSGRLWETNTKEELLANANKGLIDGTLDKMGVFDNLIGAVISIKKTTTIEIDGDKYNNIKFEIETIGTLSENEIHDMQGFLLNNFVD